MKEVWKDVIDYEGLYQASNLGRIKSLYCRVGKNPTILKPAKVSSGYLAVTLCKNNHRKTATIHSLVISSFYGISEKHVNHIDGIKTNNHLSNLEYVTPIENAHHAMRLNLRALGESHGMSKVTKKDVIKIRELRASGIRMVDLQKQFSMSKSAIHCIVHRIRWKSI